MGIFFHRRAERANCSAPPIESGPTEIGTFAPEDPRQQFSEIRNQRVETTARKSNLPGQNELPPAAPSVDAPSKNIDASPPAHRTIAGEHNAEVKNKTPQLPQLILTDTPGSTYRRTAANDVQPQTYRRATSNDVPPPPIPNPPDDVVPARPLLRNDRVVPPPPLPDPELSGTPTRDLYQYADGKPQRTTREVTPSPYPHAPERDLPRLPADTPPEFRDHPGPGSIRRRTLQEQLNLPERQSPNPGRTPTTLDSFVPQSAPTARTNDRLHAPIEIRQPLPTLPGDGKVTDISAAQLKQLMARADRPIVVDIWQERCGGCEAIAPVMNQLAAQYKGQASVYKIHSQEFLRDPELRNRFKFSAVPTTLMFDSGRLLDQHTGAREPGFYAQKLNAAIARHSQPNYNTNTPYDQNRLRPQERTPNVIDDHVNERRHHRLDERLERIREKISRLTHFSARERDVAFTPTNAEQRTLDLINNERRRHRLPDLVHDARLQMIANRHTDYQVRHGMTHNENTPGWQNVSQRMQQVGLQGWRENAGSGAFTPETLVSMWMNSPGHRAAILGTGNIGAVSIRNGKATFNLTTDPELQKNT
jgi:thioredoxin 1